MAEEWRLPIVHRPQPPTLDAQSSQSSHLLGACLVQGIGSGQRLIEIAVFYRAGNKGAQRGTGFWATMHRSLPSAAQVFAQRGTGLCSTRLRSLPKAARVFAQQGTGLCQTRQGSLLNEAQVFRHSFPIRSDLASFPVGFHFGL